MAGDFYKTAGQRIKQMRIARNHSREELAELADISTKFLYEIETGRNGFSAKVLFRLAEALEVQCDYLLGGTYCQEKHMELSQILKCFSASELEYNRNMLFMFHEFLHC